MDMKAKHPEPAEIKTEAYEVGHRPPYRAREGPWLTLGEAQILFGGRYPD